MRIALYGYGRMGKAIEAAATERGHEVMLRVRSSNTGAAPTGADVAIEFSTPDQALANLRLCIEHQVPVVVGTTGWYDRINEVRALVEQRNGSLLWASNFSVGVNLLFRLNRQLAALMERQPAYAVRIDEVHHVHKLDAPSGTAISLATDIDLRNARYSGWEVVRDHGIGGQQGPVPITSERMGEVTGKHSITWSGPHDRLTLTHEAFDRGGFAQGAVLAAEWLVGRTGLFTMDDVLDVSP